MAGGLRAVEVRWCREARRIARRAGRTLEVDDLLAVVQVLDARVSEPISFSR